MAIILTLYGAILALAVWQDAQGTHVDSSALPRQSYHPPVGVQRPGDTTARF